MADASEAKLWIKQKAYDELSRTGIFIKSRRLEKTYSLDQVTITIDYLNTYLASHLPSLAPTFLTPTYLPPQYFAV